MRFSLRCVFIFGLLLVIFPWQGFAKTDDKRYPLLAEFAASNYYLNPGQEGTYTITLAPYPGATVKPDVRFGQPQINIRLRSLHLVDASLVISPPGSLQCTQKIMSSSATISCDQLYIPDGKITTIAFTFLPASLHDGTIATRVNVKEDHGDERDYRLKTDHTSTIHYKEPSIKVDADFSRTRREIPEGTYTVSLQNFTNVNYQPESFSLRLKNNKLIFLPNSLQVVPTPLGQLCSIDEDTLLCKGLSLPAHSTIEVKLQSMLEKERRSNLYELSGTITGKLKIKGYKTPFVIRKFWQSTLWNETP